MSMIELVVAVCLTAQPDVCSEKHIPFLEASTPFSCMIRAQPFLANWATQNREWTIKTWKCSYPRARERDA